MIEKEGMHDRISVRQGDWTTDSFGDDNDVVLFSNVLHGPGSDAEMKLGKAYDSKDEIFNVITKSGFHGPKLAAESEETGSGWITVEKS